MFSLDFCKTLTKIIKIILNLDNRQVYESTLMKHHIWPIQKAAKEIYIQRLRFVM